MEQTLGFIEQRHGSVDAFLDSIGFDSEWRARLRQALLLQQS